MDNEEIKVGIYNTETQKVFWLGEVQPKDFSVISNKRKAVVNGTILVHIKEKNSNYYTTEDGKLYNFRCEDSNFVPIILKENKQYTLIMYDWMEIIDTKLVKLSMEERNKLINIPKIHYVRCEKGGCPIRRGSEECKTCNKLKAQVVCWELIGTNFKGWYGNATDESYYSEIENKVSNPIYNKEE